MGCDCKQAARICICIFWLVPPAILCAALIYDNQVRCKMDIPIEIIVLCCSYVIQIGFWLAVLTKRVEERATLFLLLSSAVNAVTYGFLGYRLYNTCLSLVASVAWFFVFLYGLVAVAPLCACGDVQYVRLR